MFSPQFMGYIIDPKSTSSSSESKQVPKVYNNNEIKSDIANLKGSADKLVTLNKDVFQSYKNNIEKYDKASPKDTETPPVIAALASAIPGVRRVPNEVEPFKQGNYFSAIGAAFLMLINVEEDCRDFKIAAKQILGKGVASNINTKTTQLKFSFFRGTLLQPLLDKFKTGRAFMINFDKTLIDFRPIRMFVKKLDNTIKFKTIVEDKEQVWNLSKIFKKMPEKTLTTASYIEVSEGKALSKIAVKSLARIPVLNLLVSSLFEMPNIVKAFKNGDGGRQIGRSAINIASFTTGSAILGAALTAALGPAGSVIGLGVGSWLGSIVGNKISKYIFGESIESKKIAKAV